MPYLKRTAPDPEPIDCRILTAALELFVDNGYHNVSIHEIQKNAKVSIGSIYNHFGGKEGVANALYLHILNEIDELVEDAKAEFHSPSEQCRVIIERLFNYTESHRSIIAFVFHTKHNEFLSNKSSMTFTSAPFVKMSAIVEQGMQYGEFRQADPWVMMASIFGGAIRMIQLRLDGQLSEPLPSYYDDVIESVWQGAKAA